MSKFLVSSAFPNKNSRGVALGLARAGKLAVFCTSFAFVEGSILHRFASFFNLKPLLKRFVERDFKAKLLCFPKNECLRRLPKWLAFGDKLSADDVRSELDQKVAMFLNSEKKHNITGVYVYADESHSIIQVAKNMNLCAVYELHVPYYKEIQTVVAAEVEKSSSWVEKKSLYVGANAGARIDRELELADVIVVASSYTKESLRKNGFEESKIKVIPYGFPAAVSKPYPNVTNRKMRLLYVGSLGVTKGVRYLLEAIEELTDQVELTVVGSGHSSFALDEAIKKHRYIKSLPNNEVLALMREADIFVFPTLSDGFGMVVTEAMSQGTPVITTPNGCGGDLIIDGENGWLVPAADSEALRQKILNIIADPSILEQVGKAALKTAESRSWEVYGAEVADYLASL